MSLHGKVVAWFAVFASVVVTLFVLGDYYQSTRALQLALEARAGALAREVATDIERRYEAAQADLRDLGHEVAAGATATTDVRFDDYAAIQVFRDGKPVFQHTGTASPPEPFQCTFGSVPFMVEFNDAAGHRYRVEATMSAAHYFSHVGTSLARIGKTGVTTVMANDTRKLVFDNGCVIRSNDVPFRLEYDVSVAVTEMVNQNLRMWTIETVAEDERPYLVAVARAEHPAWSVAIGLDYAQWEAPFVTARTQYLGVMLALLAVMLLITLHMIRGEMQRLSAITRAADAIGHGRFDVWLPPPTGDEIGRLSLSLGQMVNRLSSTIRQMEINAAMAAVGEMATYLSHEIRNPLSSIRLNLQMLRRDLQKGATPEDGEQLVALCLTEMQRLSDVVNTVLEVGRKGRVNAGYCDAHEVIDETLRVMKSKFAAHGVDVDMRLGATESDTGIEAAKLKSVLINLLLNSIDALAEAPTRRITITTELLDLPEGTQLELRVLDTGPGVSHDLATKIFDPFFTTKATGSGIGLATAMRIVRDCGGTIDCIPTDEGTGGGEFVVTLPLVNTAVPTAPAELAAAV